MWRILSRPRSKIGGRDDDDAAEGGEPCWRRLVTARVLVEAELVSTLTSPLVEAYPPLPDMPNW